MDRLGRFVIRGTLGRGAMGVVYDGWDPQIERRVAIKTVKLAVAEDDEEAAEGLARFKREAQAAGRMSHENIVGVFDFGETDEIAYIVMEFVEGRSLKSLLDQEQQLPPAEAAEIMLQVLHGLDYSHRRGVVHRDIKPANIMLTTDGQVKLADFGIARITSSSMTSVGVILGTPAYMPPEQFMGEIADERSDIYAAGATLFHLLTGHRPYEGNPTSIMQKVLNAEGPPDPSLRSVTLSPVWDRVVRGSMARRPEDRFASAAVFADAIRAALASPAPIVAQQTDADATIVLAPGRSSPQPQTERPGPQQPAWLPTSSLPSPAPAAPGRPFRLYGSIAAVVLLIAGAASWFALRPATPIVSAPPVPLAQLTPPRPHPPAPVSPPAPTPVRSVPAPVVPSLESARAALSAMVADIPCSITAVTLSDGVLHLDGVGNAAAQDRLRAAATTARSAEPTIKRSPDAYCELFDILRPVVQTRPLASSTNSATNEFKIDAIVRASIADLPFTGWLELSYVSSDGTVTQVYPSAGGAFGYDPATLQAAGSTFLTGAPHAVLGANPPPGTDMIVALETSKPLFQKLPTQSQPISAYAADLKAALSALRAAGGQAAASVLLITIVPR